jgi:hypothetical protein
LLVTANVVPSSPILVTLKMEALRSSETSVLTIATQRNIPEDGILQLFCLHTPRCNFSSTLYHQSCLYIITFVNIQYLKINKSHKRLLSLGWSGTKSTSIKAIFGLFTSPGCYKMMIVKTLMEGMIGRGNRSTRRKPAQCRSDHHRARRTRPVPEPGPV